jgi:HK97 family phage major capsid protein
MTLYAEMVKAIHDATAANSFVPNRMQWVINNDFASRIRMEQDGSGNYLWQFSTLGDTILALPFVIDHDQTEAFKLEEAR